MASGISAVSNINRECILWHLISYMNMQANTPPDFTVKTDRDDLDLPAEQVVVAYHERTKHHYHRYAASLGYLDWAKQPDPFRRYDGAPLVRLPFPDAGRALPYWQLYVADNMVPAPLSVDSISLFFRYAFSLTAWKRFEGTTWSLRANPSSGNLHPTEGYVLLPSMDAIHNRPGVYHYASKAHGLELRADFDPSVWAALTATFPEGSFLVGLSSILWREAWKYGERAFRYCQHDVGHALGSMRFAAAALGWKFRLLDRVGNAAVSQLLGLDRESRLPRRGAGASRTRGACGQGEMGQRPGPLPVQRVGIPGGQFSMVRHG
jgi:SagB-type dehydrogenase family enzyme